QEPFSLLAACIGQRTTLEGVMPEEGGETMASRSSHSFVRDYRSEEDGSLFCVGSAVGDHYVRFLVGGAMHASCGSDRPNYDLTHRTKGGTADRRRARERTQFGGGRAGGGRYRNCGSGAIPRC
ncbi:hypothetical protein PENTCL1PPCAC_19451, partial [Pristionchus entomophagus]